MVVMLDEPNGNLLFVRIRRILPMYLKIEL